MASPSVAAVPRQCLAATGDVNRPWSAPLRQATRPAAPACPSGPRSRRGRRTGTAPGPGPAARAPRPAARRTPRRTLPGPDRGTPRRPATRSSAGIGEAGVAPVDDTGGRPVGAHQDVAQVEVAVDQHRVPGRRRQRVGGRDHLVRRRGRPPSRRPRCPRAASRSRKSRAIGPRVLGVPRRIGSCGRSVARVPDRSAASAGSCRARRKAPSSRPAGPRAASGARLSASSAPRRTGAAQKRPRVVLGGPAEELGHRHGSGSRGPAAGSSAISRASVGSGHLPAGEAHRPGVVDQVDRDVPADSPSGSMVSSARSGNWSRSSCRADRRRRPARGPRRSRRAAPRRNR